MYVLGDGKVTNELFLKRKKYSNPKFLLLSECSQQLKRLGLMNEWNERFYCVL